MTPHPQDRAESALLTIDEARTEIVRSAVTMLERASCSADGKLAMLWALPGGATWSAEDEDLALEHRTNLEWVNQAGHGGLIAEELMGVMRVTGLDDGQCRDLDLLRDLAFGRDEQLAS